MGNSSQSFKESTTTNPNSTGPKRTNYDHLFKLLLIGDSSVGKSSLVLRFSDDSFLTSFITTIGVDFKIKTIEIDGKVVKLQIWDTAGQERFRSITDAYYRGAMGIMLVYTVCDEQSFSNIRKWISHIHQHAAENVQKILVGHCWNDDGDEYSQYTENDRVISYERGEEMATDYGVPFCEASAKTGCNVKEAFKMLAESVYKVYINTDYQITAKMTNNINVEKNIKGIEEKKNEENEVRLIDLKQNDHENTEKKVLKGAEKYFYDFLKEARLTKYFDKFKENDCCDLRDIEFINDELLNEIGINRIALKKFKKHSQEIRNEMEEFNQLTSTISPIIIKKLKNNFGIVTMNILCSEIKQKFNLKKKYQIENDMQCELLWDIIQRHINPQNNQQENEHNVNDDDNEYQEEGVIGNDNYNNTVTPYM